MSPNCYSFGGALIGASGTGKSSIMSAISLLYEDPVIIHNSYEGMKFRHTQIVIMIVRCPPGGSKKSLCYAILDKFDELLFMLSLIAKLFSGLHSVVEPDRV